MNGYVLNLTRKFGPALITALLFASPIIPAAAQDIAAKLSAARMGDIEPGLYQAGDRIDFLLTPIGDRYLFKLADSNEVYVLTTDRMAQGGRVLKYDTGATAVQVSGLGSLTLYPEGAPNGLPAVLTGEPTKFVPETVSLLQLQNAAQDVGRRLNVTVAADWTVFAVDAGARTFGLEALENFDQGAQHFLKQRGHLAPKIDTLQLQAGIGPTLLTGGKRLLLGFRPDQGYAGRLSSRARSFPHDEGIQPAEYCANDGNAHHG